MALLLYIFIYPFNYVLEYFVLFFVLYPCMAIIVSVKNYGGFSPGIILLTQCYYLLRGTRLIALKRFSTCNL